MRNSRLWVLLTIVAATILSFSQARDSKPTASQPADSRPPDTKPAASATAPTPKEGEAVTAEQKFKNIQSLKGTPADQFIPTMQYFSVSLGVDCGYCHVNKPTWAPESDDKKEKQTAREMIAMTQSVNQASFKGRPTVGCATCHAGHSNPNPVPPFAEASKRQGPSQDTLRLPTPSADQVLQSYYTAIGGKDALAKLTSKVTKGLATTPLGPSYFEFEQKEGNLYRMSLFSQTSTTVTTTNGEAPQKHWDRNLNETYAEGFNGSGAWRKTSRWTGELTGLDLSMARLNGVLFDPALAPDPKAINARVSTETVNGHECYVLRENTSEPGFFERLYFDQKSGLLVRRITLQRTLFGPLPFTWDYDDYRDVHGVKAPFSLTHIDWNSTVVFKADSVEFNLPLDESTFQQPSKPTQKNN